MDGLTRARVGSGGLEHQIGHGHDVVRIFPRSGWAARLSVCTARSTVARSLLSGCTLGSMLDDFGRHGFCEPRNRPTRTPLAFLGILTSTFTLFVSYLVGSLGHKLGLELLHEVQEEVVFKA